MRLTAHALYEQAVAITPARAEPAWAAERGALSTDLGLRSAGGTGWDVLCPYAIEATWNGGPGPEDIVIRIDAPADAPSFVQSALGRGLLTFYPGYQFKTDDGQALWVRGPINAPKDGLYPLEQIVDTTMLPCTIAVHWTFTRPQQTIRFAAGESFGTLLLYPVPFAETDSDQDTLDIVPVETDVAVYEAALEQMISDPALQSLFLGMGATPLEHADAAEPPPEQLAALPTRWATQLTDPPPVSCLCLTYGRTALLEEAIYSFLQQDYPGVKELIVLNDYAAQTLTYDHPEVLVVNVPTRFHSLGEKYKAAAALATHDLLFVWHDDDIYLPHRLSFSVAQLGPTHGFFKSDKAWFWNDGTLSGPERNTFHGGCCWRRELFVKVQGYPHVTSRYDVDFEQLCQDEDPRGRVVHPTAPTDIAYIYRWSGTGSYHLSGMEQNGREDRQVAAYVQRQAEAGQIELGQLQLQPHWNTDYPALVQAYLKDNQLDQATAQAEEIPFPPPFYVIPAPPPLSAAQADQLFQGHYPRKISVILPAANESVLLQRTVEQFAATLPANSEIIVVDNGSKDGSADFLVDAPHANIHLIRTPEPLGVSGARNRGLAEACGEIVVFADAHIDLPELWWQPIVCVLNQPHVGVVGPGIGVMGKPEHPAAYGQRIAESNLRVEWLSRQGDEPYPVPTLGGGFMAMRHDTLKAAGTFDAGMPEWGSEDLELCVRYWLLGYEVWVAPAVTVLHYFRNANPYKVSWGAITHNLLRVALLHFNDSRLTRVIAALKSDTNFAPALAHAVESDVWQQRAAFATRRVRDDAWLFERFADSCEV